MHICRKVCGEAVCRAICMEKKTEWAGVMHVLDTGTGSSARFVPVDVMLVFALASMGRSQRPKAADWAVGVERSGWWPAG